MKRSFGVLRTLACAGAIGVALVACHSSTGPTVARVELSPKDTTISLTGTFRIQFHVYDSVGHELPPSEYGLALAYGPGAISIDSLSHAQVTGAEPLQITGRAIAVGSSDILVGATTRGGSMLATAIVRVVAATVASTVDR